MKGKISLKNFIQENMKRNIIYNHEVPGSIPGPATKKSIEIETVRRLPLLAVFFIKTRWEHNGNTKRY